MLASISLRRLAGGLLLTTLLVQSAQAQTTLNLKDADINTLITTVSEITGKNFIVDPRVKGKVTVISSTPMSSYEVYQTFLAVLQVQGFATVEAGGAIKIIPETNVGKEGGGYLGNQRLAMDEVATRVFSLQNASAVQLMPLLRPMMASWATLIGVPNTNVLIASDRAANLDRLGKIITQLDQAGDRDIVMVTLKNAGAADVVKTLTSLVQGDTATPEGGVGGRKTTILADERSNSILITGDKGDRERIQGIINRLDTPLGEDVTTQVVYLRYANAENLAPILEGYSQLGGSSGGSGLGGTSRTTRNTTSRNSRTTGAGATGGNTGIGGIGANTRNNGTTGIGGNTGTGTTGSANVNSGGSNPDIRVMADAETNSLIITATPKLLRQAISVIAQLDIRRPQVLVDGIVAEVSADKSNQLGIDWAVYNGERIAAAGILNPTTLSAITGAATATDPLLAAAGAVGQGLNIGGGRIGGNNGTSFALLLKALKGDGDTNVLSQPSLMTLDNQQAEFSVGQEVPFLTGSYSNNGVGGGTSGLVNPFQTIDRKDVGLTLAITPQINQGNTIQLTIDLEVSSLQSGSTGAVDLITNKRTLSNVVSVEDGQILVLSGLIDDNVSDTQRSVPYLSSIPLLGNLFKYRSVTRGRRNLMIFIRPSIVRTVADGDYYTSKKYGTLREAQMATGVNSVPLIGGKQPVLDTFEALNRNRPADAQSGTATIPPPPSVVTIPAPTAVPVPVPTPSAESAR